ncbi:MAG: MEDS domain-containing protein [Gammaproteobacteria bacterium]
MLALAEEVLSKTKRQGSCTPVGSPTWAGHWKREVRGTEDLVEYCARLNAVVANYDDTMVCTYDCAKFSARAIVDVLRWPSGGHHRRPRADERLLRAAGGALQELQRDKHHVGAA